MMDLSFIMQIAMTLGVTYIVKVAVRIEHRFTQLEDNVKQIMHYCPNCPDAPIPVKQGKHTAGE
jgi:hypothetical protein